MRKVLRWDDMNNCDAAPISLIISNLFMGCSYSSHQKIKSSISIYDSF
jgi:hypothetical protein